VAAVTPAARTRRWPATRSQRPVLGVNGVRLVGRNSSGRVAYVVSTVIWRSTSRRPGAKNAVTARTPAATVGWLRRNVAASATGRSARRRRRGQAV
jgi:hypothetical protein